MDRSALTDLYLDEVRQRGLRASDLLGDLPGLRPYYYEGKYLSRPLFIGESECRQLYADVENVRTAVVSLPDRLYGGDFTEFARAAGAYGAIAAVLASQAKPPTQLTRADLFVGETGFQLLELNQGSSIGGADNVDMCRALLRNPVLAEFASAHGLGYVDTVRNQVDTMLAETGLEPDSHPVVAITRWPNGFDEMMNPYLEAVAADWQKLGIDAYGCQLPELSCHDGRVWLRGRPLDAIYRMFFIGQLHEHSRARVLLKPILDAVARGEVKMCAPLESDMFSSKATIAMISDDANRQVFTAAELESIDRIVPWTRLVRPGLVTVPDGSQAELLDYAMAQQNELILKPSMGWEGIGVMPGWELSPEEWHVQLTSVSDPWYVIQKRVRPETELFPGEDGELVPWTPVWGLFTGSPGYGGIYVRAVRDADVGVINQALGAFNGSCLSAGLASGL
ncbi:MAG TPA: hypothetical protein VN969_33265 [Streptosporangiaceae bacterium]|nr:hypothetical protein [Streptosporangiaceae bacterium]